MKLCIVTLLAIFYSTAAMAQTAVVTGGQHVHPVQLRMQSNVVLVPTLVQTKSGELVYLLKSPDFTVRDNGVQQKVHLDGDTSQQPIALVVAIQTGGAGAQQLPNLQHLDTMIEAMVQNIPHQVALMTFDSKPDVVQNFTPNLANVGKAIRAVRPGDSGAAILDCLAVSINMLRKEPPQFRRAVLLISGTVDRGSQTQLHEALRVVSETNTVIYSMAFSTSKTELKAALANTPPSPASLKRSDHGNSTPSTLGQTGFASSTAPPSPSSSDTDAAMYSMAFSSLSAAVRPTSADTPSSAASKGCSQLASQSANERLGEQENCANLLPLALFAARLGINGLSRNTPETVARLTGGEYKKFKDERSLESGLFTFANHLPNRYVLSFQPFLPTPGLHTIQVDLKDYPKLQVSARTSYWVATTPANKPQP